MNMKTKPGYSGHTDMNMKKRSPHKKKKYNMKKGASCF